MVTSVISVFVVSFLIVTSLKYRRRQARGVISNAWLRDQVRAEATQGAVPPRWRSRDRFDWRASA